jgi:hypothetical protein
MSHSEQLSTDENLETEATRRYLNELFELHPDNVQLARMWELDPEFMQEKMPEVQEGWQAANIPWWRATAQIAIKGITTALDQRLHRLKTPEQRMLDARRKLTS